MMNEKKAIGPIIGLVLLIVVSISGVIVFESWFTNYETNLESNIEIQGSNLIDLEINYFKNGMIYIKNSKPMSPFTINKIKVDNLNFNISGIFTGSIIKINLYENMCTNILKPGTHEIQIYLNKKILSKKIYLNKKDKQIKKGIIVPLYVYPSSGINTPEFKKITTLKNKSDDLIIYVILNPSNGPGTSLDSNYLSASNNFYNNNIKTLGYLYTSYALRDINIVKSEIDNWKLFYPNIKGLFIDEFSYDNNDTHINYYKDLITYSKNKGFNIIIGNPGTKTNSRYFSELELDFNLIYENALYPTPSDFSTNKNYLSKKAVLVHSQNFDKNNLNLILNNSNLIYITDDVMVNPWDTLSPSMEELCKGILSY